MQDNSALDALEEERSRLLIVDDSELNRALLANIFQQSYEIQEAENGREGLALILSEQDSLSAVLLDVVMPEMIGLPVEVAVDNLADEKYHDAFAQAIHEKMTCMSKDAAHAEDDGADTTDMESTD